MAMAETFHELTEGPGVNPPDGPTTFHELTEGRGVSPPDAGQIVPLDKATGSVGPFATSHSRRTEAVLRFWMGSNMPKLIFLAPVIALLAAALGKRCPVVGSGRGGGT